MRMLLLLILTIIIIFNLIVVERLLKLFVFVHCESGCQWHCNHWSSWNTVEKNVIEYAFHIVIGTGFVL